MNNPYRGELVVVKNKKCNSGLTLLELTIAIGVLIVASVALFALFNQGHRTSVAAHWRAQAAIEAQLQMERLMGLPWDDLLRELYETNNVGAFVLDDAGNPVPRETFGGTCGGTIFMVDIDYFIRRTNYRSLELGVMALPVPAPPWGERPDPLPAFGFTNNEPRRGDLYSPGVGTLGLLYAEAVPEVPVSIQVNIRIHDALGSLPPALGFLYFEHSNIMLVDTNPFAQDW